MNYISIPFLSSSLLFFPHPSPLSLLTPHRHITTQIHPRLTYTKRPKIGTLLKRTSVVFTSQSTPNSPSMRVTFSKQTKADSSLTTSQISQSLSQLSCPTTHISPSITHMDTKLRSSEPNMKKRNLSGSGMRDFLTNENPIIFQCHKTDIKYLVSHLISLYPTEKDEMRDFLAAFLQFNIDEVCLFSSSLLFLLLSLLSSFLFFSSSSPL
jgi:hypothetical protein